MPKLIVLFALALASAGGAAQTVRGMPEQQAVAKKPDLTAGGGSSSAGATRPALPDEKAERFNVLDLDGDGMVSLAEAAGHGELVVHFERADRDRNGKLTRAEFDHLGKKPERRSRTTARTDRGKKSTAGTRSASIP